MDKGLAFITVLLLSQSAFAAVIADDRDASFAPSPAISSPSPLVISAPVPIVPASVIPNTPLVLAQPVETENLAPIDVNAIGLLSVSTGGLGASMWKDTPRALVERLLPEASLPTSSPTLNNLARRLLLSTAAVPTGESLGKPSLVSMRLEKLLALGDTSDAWQLASIAKQGQIDDSTMQMVTEAALLGADSKNVCDKITDIMAAHNSTEWQKDLILCQLRANDTKAAQLGLDMLREQKVKDDVFVTLVNRNIIGGSKQLPRQLTPLRPMALALLQQINVPLPAELYAKPDALLIPTLLQAKAADENARLTLAEKAAARGLIGTKQLATIYQDVSLTPDVLASALNSSETGARLHAVLYQAVAPEPSQPKRIALITKFVDSTDSVALVGTLGQLLAEQATPIPVSTEQNAFSGTAVKLFTLAGKADQAMAWLKIAQGSAHALPNVAAQVNDMWPLLVLSGFISDQDYGQGLKLWLDGALKDADRAKRQRVGSMLVLFGAMGYVVPEDQWGRVVDAASDVKRVAAPSPVLLERLSNAGTTDRKGEAALLSVMLAGNDVPFFITAMAIKSLRLVGLVADAQGLAREAAASLMMQTP